MEGRAGAGDEGGGCAANGGGGGTWGVWWAVRRGCRIASVGVARHEAIGRSVVGGRGPRDGSLLEDAGVKRIAGNDAASLRLSFGDPAGEVVIAETARGIDDPRHSGG